MSTSLKLDAELISLLCEELRKECVGGKIEKVRQPAKDVVLLTVHRRSGGNCSVVISAAGGRARIHLTNTEYENPAEPPMFCMLLRKHLVGSTISDLIQPEKERMIQICLLNHDELGRSSEENLYVELMPGRPNIVLVGGDGLILDCIHRRDYEPDLYRRVYPGMIYRLPQKPENYVPYAADPALLEEWKGKSVSEALDEYYSSQEKEELFRRKSREVRNVLQNGIKRTSKKLAIQRNELEETKSRETLRRKADLITANIYRMKRGDKILVCQDFYSEDGAETEIPLDPLKSPQENAAQLYKQYNKQKTAEQYLTRLIAEGEEKLRYLESTLDALDRSESERDIQDLRRELQETGFLKQSRDQSPKKKPKPQSPLRFETSNGLEVLVGRNNLQNEELTFRIAFKSDYWFHVKNFHGSHVILRAEGMQPAESDIREAAAIAVAHSKAAGNTNTAVDYCQVRYVKKPSGSLPGRVIYTDYSTVWVKE